MTFLKPWPAQDLKPALLVPKTRHTLNFKPCFNLIFDNLSGIRSHAFGKTASVTDCMCVCWFPAGVACGAGADEGEDGGGEGSGPGAHVHQGGELPGPGGTQSGAAQPEI